MPNLARNRAGRGCPHERCGMVVPVADVVADRPHQFPDTAERSSPDALVGDFCEETLHQVQPRSPRGREVPVIAGMGGEPGFHGGMAMGAIVVQDEVDDQPARDAALNPLQKAQKLLMAMARHAIPQHFAAQHVQRREQRGGAVALVVVGLPFRESRTQGQDGLGTIQGLDLALLIHAQHQSLLRRIQVQTHDVAQLEKELGIGAELETLDAMRLQTMRLPDAIHHRRTHPLGAGQRAHAPVRGSRRLQVQRGVHDGLFFLYRQPSPASGPRGIFQQPLQPGLFKAVSPTQHRRAAGAQLPCHPVVGHSVGREQHHAEAKYDLLRRASRPRETFQQFPFLLAETQRLSSSPHAAHYIANQT